ncbi:MAG TPA: gamma-glutamyl-phosphate reductase, partial [Candidatus Manganitrophaceae bacterium]
MELKEKLKAEAQKTKEAARTLAKCATEVKNRALLAMAARLETETPLLLAENGKDLEAGKKKGLSAPLLERLTLNPKRIVEMAAGLREVAALPDPVGEVIK